MFKKKEEMTEVTNDIRSELLMTLEVMRRRQYPRFYKMVARWDMFYSRIKRFFEIKKLQFNSSVMGDEYKVKGVRVGSDQKTGQISLAISMVNGDMIEIPFTQRQGKEFYHEVKQAYRDATGGAR